MPHASEPQPQQIHALVALFSQGKYPQAATMARELTQRYPGYGFFWKALGAVLMQAGQTAQALEPLQKAAALMPQDPEAHSNLGAALRSAGRAEEAISCYQHAVALRPDYVLAHGNLGNAYRDLGRLQEAAASYQRTLSLQPDHADALEQLAYLLYSHGQHADALPLICRSLQLQETPQVRQLFVDCVKYVRWSQDDANARGWLLRALTEAWGRPNDLVRAGWALVRLSAPLPSVLTPDDLPRLDQNELLCALLQAAQICDVDIERFLTVARRSLLAWVDGGALPAGAWRFFAALANQCFINEYVFSAQPAELAQAVALRERVMEALLSGKAVFPQELLAVASYFPLASLAHNSMLLQMPSHDVLQPVLTQQLREPEEELQLRGGMLRLTPIEDAMSQEVRAQYEESPYPRWVRLSANASGLTLNQTLQQLLPRSGFVPLAQGNAPRILVAGCGTGQHPIETALRFANARLLAVDLSLSSLGYAKRKVSEMGTHAIEFAQADILQLGTLQERFDVVESSGVLHHLADPHKGWRVLLELLKPGGVMKLGFYSALARRDIVRIREYIAQRGYSATVEGIRQCRQELQGAEDPQQWGRVTKSSDFFSTSTCRDLLFHVQEHRTTLTAIAAFLHVHGLKFLGFELDPHIVNAYRDRFPNDPAATDLAQWQQFEDDNPDVFFNMYQFWVQK
jgi:Flp pilus assembly protein TadD/SAM-dependent methyltransferase